MPPTPWWAKARAREWLAAEAALAAHILGPLTAFQILELAPAGLPAAGIGTRLGLDPVTGRWALPVQAGIDRLPVCDQCLDIVLWRYLPLPRRAWWRLAGEVARCLKPGGRLLVSTINPLQPTCWRAIGWRELARQTPDPGWPFGIAGLHVQASRSTGGRRPLQPVRVQLLIKSGDPRIVLPLPRRNGKLAAVPQTAATRTAWFAAGWRRAA